jgi:sugar-specific transcriptional regulator TrmB
MSKEWMYQILLSQGLPQTDARIYVFLTTEGPKSRKIIAQSLNLHKHELYRSLNRLTNKEFITIISQQPATFSTLSFDKVLRLLLEFNKKQTKDLQESKDRILTSWHTLMDKKG